MRQDGGYDLRVPHGLEQSSAQDALALLFKTFVVFRRSQLAIAHLEARDGVEHRSDGRDTGGHGVSFYDALALDELFDRVDPRGVLSLNECPARLDQEMPKRIDRHLHLALFDDRGAAHFDRVPGTRRVARHSQTDIVGLYCVLALDFYRNFLAVDPRCGWGAFAAEAEALAQDFRHRHLTQQDSLFQSDTAASERSREQFRYLLAQIDRASPVRDAQYRRIHDALHRYLHAGLTTANKAGQVWGVRDFWAVWESICLHHAMLADDDTEGLSSIWTCDHAHLPRGLAGQQLERDWARRRERVFVRNEIERRPDLVRRRGQTWTVVDFKYYAEPHERRPKWVEDATLAKAERDFLNLELYGLMLQVHLLADPQHAGDRIALEMWLPGSNDTLAPMKGMPAWNPPLTIRRVEMRSALERYSSLYGR
ncbi:MAG: hypothetical protein J0M19_14045 [Sphingomonadales bacterium]|nr:hypothetical protein [Sphingomonadales bacterium]